MPKTEEGDRPIYILDHTAAGPLMKKVADARRPDQANFVIVCDYGDWSGFRTLPECIAQFPTLETTARKYQRPIGYYAVVER